MHAHLRATLRRRWRDLTPPLVALGVMTGCLALPSGGHPTVQGFFVGVCAGVLLMLVIWMLFVIDGSLLRRIGLGVASDVGDELRQVRGVHAVVSELLFDGYDVDHVIVAPTGVFAVEVKWSLSPTPDLDRVYGLAGYLHQTRAGARSVTGLLRPVDPGVTVHAVLVLAGPGAPRLPDPVHRDGVTVVNPMTTKDWTTFLGHGKDPVLTMTDACPLVDALVAQRDKRIAYELAHR
jgi:hypothetical protein